MAMTEAQKIERTEELYEKAVSNFLNKADFDISEWLDDKDMKEYCKLSQETHQMDQCICDQHKE